MRKQAVESGGSGVGTRTGTWVGGSAAADSTSPFSAFFSLQHAVTSPAVALLQGLAAQLALSFVVSYTLPVPQKPTVALMVAHLAAGAALQYVSVVEVCVRMVEAAGNATAQ